MNEAQSIAAFQTVYFEISILNLERKKKKQNDGKIGIDFHCCVLHCASKYSREQHNIQLNQIKLTKLWPCFITQFEFYLSISLKRFEYVN